MQVRSLWVTTLHLVKGYTRSSGKSWSALPLWWAVKPIWKRGKILSHFYIFPLGEIPSASYWWVCVFIQGLEWKVSWVRPSLLVWSHARYTHGAQAGPACPRWALRRWPSFRDSEPPSRGQQPSWSDCAMPTDSFRLNVSSPPCFFFLALWIHTHTENISLQRLWFLRKQILSGLLFKKILIPLISLTILFCTCPVHAPFLGFNHLTISDAFRWPLSSTVVRIFPYLCHSWLTWYVPGCLALAFCFFIVTLWCTGTFRSFFYQVISNQ